MAHQGRFHEAASRELLRAGLLFTHWLRFFGSPHPAQAGLGFAQDNKGMRAPESQQVGSHPFFKKRSTPRRQSSVMRAIALMSTPAASAASNDMESML